MFDRKNKQLIEILYIFEFIPVSLLWGGGSASLPDVIYKYRHLITEKSTTLIYIHNHSKI